MGRATDATRAVTQSANSIAALRAVESERADGLMKDPWARELAGARAMARADARARREDGDKGRIAVRTKFFDDFVTAAAGKMASARGETTQVVLLGAGYDTRSWRLRAASEEARERTSVYEVDVTSLSDFGAFVEVCDGQGEASGLEGLVHISEISWNRISHPRDAVKVGQREFVKVLEVNDETGRINFSIKQTQADPLMETLETIMPVTMPEPSIDEDDLSEIPLPGLPDICSSLLKEDGIEAVIPGRQAMEQRVVSQDLELWLTNVFVEDGYNLLARAGRQVQEIHVVTRLDRDAIKRAIKRATSVAKSQ